MQFVVIILKSMDIPRNLITVLVIGLGLEIHEEPVANTKSDTVFTENMIITVEPRYLYYWYYRIENRG